MNYYFKHRLHPILILSIESLIHTYTCICQDKKSTKYHLVKQPFNILLNTADEKIICTGSCSCFRECVRSLLIRRAGGTTVSCVLELVVRDLLHLLSCYYSVKSCRVFPKKGSYFISTFCLCLNVSDALSAIFTCFNSVLHPNQNIQPYFAL